MTFIKCDVIDIFHLLGKKWALALLYNITDSPVTFNKLYSYSDGKISSILLSNRIKELIHYNLVQVYKKDNKKCYIRTQKGKELMVLIQGVKTWAKKNDYNLPDDCKKGSCMCKEVFSSKYKYSDF